ncbi:hypothetical protein BHE74_00023144 [Ensete ventricosum]|nr:hypothetical protein BHE74_00023144 [Ensete ventricosum]
MVWLSYARECVLVRTSMKDKAFKRTPQRRGEYTELRLLQDLLKGAEGGRERGHEENEPDSIQLGPRRCGAGKTAAPASSVADQGTLGFAASCGLFYWGFWFGEGKRELAGGNGVCRYVDGKRPSQWWLE